MLSNVCIICLVLIINCELNSVKYDLFVQYISSLVMTRMHYITAVILLARVLSFIYSLLALIVDKQIQIIKTVLDR